MKYSVHVRCPDGPGCGKPHRADGSWNARDGSVGFAARIPTPEGKAATKAAVDHASALLDLGTDEQTRARIGGMIYAPRSWRKTGRSRCATGPRQSCGQRRSARSGAPAAGMTCSGPRRSAMTAGRRGASRPRTPLVIWTGRGASAGRGELMSIFSRLARGVKVRRGRPGVRSARRARRRRLPGTPRPARPPRAFPG